MNTTTIMTGMQMILAFCNICIIGYGFYKFLNTPRDSMEQRITTLEVEVKNLKSSQEHDQDTLKVLTRSTLALIEFEMQYCMTENKDMSDSLKAAKRDLEEFLSQRRP
jgi:hypothetical protein